MRSRWFVLIGASALLLAAAPAAANDASFGGCGGILTGLEGQAVCVPVRDEVITLDVVELSFAPVRDKGGTWWQVEARYTLHNTGDRRSAVIGFPVQQGFAPDSGWDGLPLDYRVTLDGEPLEPAVFDVKAEGQGGAAEAAKRHRYSHVYLVEVPFGREQRRVLVHRYRLGLTQDNYGFRAVDYILTTGALWKGGRIGRISVSIGLPGPVAYDHFAFSFEAPTVDDAIGNVSWSAEDFAPARDLRLTWMISEMIAWDALGRSLAGGAEAVDQGKLGEEPDAALQAAYAGILAAFRYDKVPVGWIYDPKEPDADGPAVGEGMHRIRPKPRPGLALREMPTHLSGPLVALDAELTKRKLKHAALPPK
ncbi:MAG: hypothetical protein ABIK09_14680 [Pseudomonadota bacterium]